MHLAESSENTTDSNLSVMRISILTLLLCIFSTGLHAATPGNPIKGEELFGQCAMCHTVGEGAQNTVGPNLNHLFGRKAGTVEGANYSDAMRAKGTEKELVWQENSLFQFLAGPARYVSGTIMGFEGLRTEKDIKNVLSYLIQFSPAYEANSLAYIAPKVASATALPEMKSSAEDEAIPEFTAKYMASVNAIENGGELWAKQCRHCHGSSAYPGKAPKLRPSAYKPDFVFDRITNGFRKMPAWKSVFTLEQRKELVAHILSSEFSP
ncbi:MAG: cytochrome c2 [Gammaproteobacteria bacterium]|jgi:cytochrome c2